MFSSTPNIVPCATLFIHFNLPIRLTVSGPRGLATVETNSPAGHDPIVADALMRPTYRESSGCPRLLLNINLLANPYREGKRPGTTL